jgi:hypothetical protein
LQQAGVRRDEARAAAARLVKERRRLHKRFGPDLDVRPLIVPAPGGRVTTVLVWRRPADLDPTLEDVADSMMVDSMAKHVFDPGAVLSAIRAEFP